MNQSGLLMSQSPLYVPINAPIDGSIDGNELLMNQSPAPLVSIIIPTFNKYELTENCLRALKGSTIVSHEIIVVDNNSLDGTYNRILNDFPEVRAIKNRENKNFSGACNIGARSAQGHILVFLNNDTLPFDGWLEPLIAELEHGAGVVGAKLLYPDNTIQHAGVAFMRETRFPHHPYRGFAADHPAVNHRRELQVITGACLAIRRADFFDIGLFNEEYINGGEDIELCLKMRQKGHKIVYQPKSVLIHLESQSPGRMDKNDENVKLFFKNFSDYLLSDEDAFYFEDGLYRNTRTQLDALELTPIKDPKTEAQWKHLADLQLSFAGSKYAAPHLITNVPILDWPHKADVHEWLGLVADKQGFYQAASAFFKQALILSKMTERARALGTLNTSVFLNPHFNKYFAKE